MREYPGNQESEELATADIPAANKEANAISQKLVKTASTRFQVADINKSLNEISGSLQNTLAMSPIQEWLRQHRVRNIV